jgi:hypothetical protein
MSLPIASWDVRVSIKGIGELDAGPFFSGWVAQ